MAFIEPIIVVHYGWPDWRIRADSVEKVRDFGDEQ